MLKMDKRIIEILKRIKNNHGDSIFQNKNMFNGLVSDYSSGQFKGEINLINITLNLGIYNEIKSWPKEYNKIRTRYIMRLKTEYFFTEEQAIFAVDAWGIVSGVIKDFSNEVIEQDVLKPVEQKKITRSEATGNFIGNIINGGFAVRQGDWIYFRKQNDLGSIYKTNVLDENKIYKLNSDNAMYINVVGEWLYYKDYGQPGAIYKMKTDGSNRDKLIEDKVSFITVINDWIYYQNESDGDKIYKIKTDGSSRSLVCSDATYSLNVIGNWIYYRNDSDKNRIYKIKTDGSNKMKLTEERCYDNILVDGDWIYYIDWLRELYKVKLDGSNKTKVSNSKISQFIISHGMIFFTLKSNDYWGSLYKMDLKGKNITKLDNDQSANMSIVSDWIYYINREKKMFSKNYTSVRIKLDGTCKSMI